MNYIPYISLLFLLLIAVFISIRYFNEFRRSLNSLVNSEISLLESRLTEDTDNKISSEISHLETRLNEHIEDLEHQEKLEKMDSVDKKVQEVLKTHLVS